MAAPSVRPTVPRGTAQRPRAALKRDAAVPGRRAWRSAKDLRRTPRRTACSMWNSPAALCRSEARCFRPGTPCLAIGWLGRSAKDLRRTTQRTACSTWNSRLPATGPAFRHPSSCFSVVWAEPTTGGRREVVPRGTAAFCSRSGVPAPVLVVLGVLAWATTEGRRRVLRMQETLSSVRRAFSGGLRPASECSVLAPTGPRQVFHVERRPGCSLVTAVGCSTWNSADPAHCWGKPPIRARGRA
jgi:hypothetical protein